MTATLDSLIALIEERGWYLTLFGPWPLRPGLMGWDASIRRISVNGPPIGQCANAESALAAVTQAIRQAERATGGSQR